jgi:predicted porin
MKKTLVALAALAATSAFAQSTVTVAGIVDQAYSTVTQNNRAGTKETKQTGIGEGGWAGSRIRFSGVEDMGGGLKATFWLEQGIAVSDGNGFNYRNGGNGPQFVNGTGMTNQNRQSYVGLEGGFGTVRLGRLYAASYDMWTNQGYINGEFTGTANAGAALQSRTKGISYQSPVMNNVDVYITYGGGNTDHMDTTSTEDQVNSYRKRVNKLMTSRVMYKNGPLHLGATYETADESCTANGAPSADFFGKAITAGTCNATDVESKYTALLAQYDFGVAKVNYITSNKNAVAVKDGAKTDTKFSQINVKVPLNAKTELRYTTNTSKATNGTVSDFKGDLVGVAYSFSKRTTGYVFTGSQKDNTATDAVTVKEKRTAIGIAHAF